MRLSTASILSAFTIAISGPADAQTHSPDGSRSRGISPVEYRGIEVFSMRDRAGIVDAWLQERLDNVVPDLMRREGIDMWIISAREYNEDPVIETMLPATWLRARRRTILAFHDDGEAVHRYAISRYDVGDFFDGIWDPEQTADQWVRLAELVQEVAPRRIALNRSQTYALADGLSATEYEGLLAALDPMYQSRIVGGEKLAVGWLETRTPSEMERYAQICRLAHEIIAEGLSDATITPGKTTTDDLEWWFRERVRDLRLVTWFHPSVSIQRETDSAEGGDYSSRAGARVIEPGDLVHVDFGITYLRLNTDTQQHAYVLKPGETSPPVGLVRGLAEGNRLQDILMDGFMAGRSGNEILEAALTAAAEEGIAATVYTHPIGFHGHGAGPTIGLWDRQDGVPGVGDYPLYPSTAYSIELNVAVELPEWGGKEVKIKLEEDAYFDGVGVRFIDGRQTAFHVLGRG
jgi:Xaa-Pro aminopeptidase